jgi:hypothetical protein
MAGNEDGEAVVRTDAAGRSLGVRMSCKGSQLAVGDDLAVRNGPQGADNSPLEWCTPVEVELDPVEGRALASEVGDKPLGEGAQGHASDTVLHPTHDYFDGRLEMGGGKGWPPRSRQLVPH